MNWLQLDSQEKLSEIKKLSSHRRILIFFFSKQHTIDYIIKYTIEREWNPREMEMPVYFFDVDKNRNLTDILIKEFGILSVTPQVVIIENGKKVFSAIEGEIDFKTIRDWANHKNLIQDGIKTASSQNV
jgi:bacillithiol system protein YtxJ